MKNICVFCGSSFGDSDNYKKAAQELGALLAQNEFRLIYGGGNVGLMGAVADSVLENGGSVIGVIPEFLQRREVGHTGLSELIIVDSMHERKMKMAELADAFIALPGGFGTLEELAEITTWVQLDLMNKPIGVLNVNEYYNHLSSYITHMKKEKFISKENSELIIFDSKPENLLNKLIDLESSDNKVRTSRI